MGDTMQTFVTGGTGLLGNNLVRQLVAAGHDVTVLVRSPEKAKQVLGDLNVEFVVGDITDVAGFETALEGAEVLFHAAAYFREYYTPGDHRETLQAVNVDATVDLLEAATNHGVSRVVYVSSNGVIGPSADGGLSDEADLLDPDATENRYFRSKILAELAIDEFLETHDLSVVRILPGWMFGPWDAAPTAAGQLVIDMAQGSMPGVFDGGEHITDARDVARAMLVAAEQGVAPGRYLVAGPYTTLSELAAFIESATGTPAPRRLPYPLVALAARAGDIYGRLTGRDVGLTTAATRSLRPSRRTDSSKAVGELGVTFRPLEETIRDELAWFVEHGYLDAGVVPRADESAPEVEAPTVSD
jgi:dihydroflavonol-4-reductase